MFDTATYVDRRRKLAAGMDSGIALFLGNDEAPLNYRDNHYRFRQDSSFLYFWGLSEANLAATMDYFEGKAVGLSSDLPHFDCEDMGAPTALVENDDLTAEQKYRLLNANTAAFFGLKIPAAARAATE